MGFKILRTGSFLYRTYQQQVRSLPPMGFKILRTGFPMNRKVKDQKKINGQRLITKKHKALSLKGKRKRSKTKKKKGQTKNVKVKNYKNNG